MEKRPEDNKTLLRQDIMKNLPILGLAYGIPAAAFMGILLDAGHPLLNAGVGALGGLLLGGLVRRVLRKKQDEKQAPKSK